MCPDVSRTGFAIFLLAIGSLAIASQACAQNLLPPGKPVAERTFTIDVPKDWSRFKPAETGTRSIYLIGDGHGVSPLDETGRPLQVGLSVERFPNDQSVQARVDLLKAETLQAPGRKLIGEVVIEAAKLKDGQDGTLMYSRFDKAPNRKSLYEKFIVADPKAGTWVVTGWIVTGPDSTLPLRDSALEKRINSYVKSFRPRGLKE